MIAMVGAVLVASLVGSLHCAGMCGVFVAMACGLDQRGGSAHARLQSAYHGGRLVGYTTLGVIAGSLGRALDLGASAVGLAHGAAILAAVTMLVIGVGVLLQDRGVRVTHLKPPQFVQRAFRKGVALSEKLTPTRRALTIGLLTALLPCGWLYAFALVAAGTASPAWGAAIMASFWVGTVPVLAGVGLGARVAHTRLGPWLRTTGAVVIVALGAFTLFRVSDADLSVVRAAMGAEAGAAELRSSSLDAASEAPCPLCVEGEANP